MAHSFKKDFEILKIFIKSLMPIKWEEGLSVDFKGDTYRLDTTNSRIYKNNSPIPPSPSTLPPFELFTQKSREIAQWNIRATNRQIFLIYAILIIFGLAFTISSLF